LLSILWPFIAGLAGNFVGNWLTSRRESKHRLQEQRIQYLIEAYRAFAKSNHLPRLCRVADELEQAIADIQLLGSPELISLAQAFCREMADKEEAGLDEILVMIRQNLRTETRRGSSFRQIHLASYRKTT
jgi:hypothetical protein